MDCELRPSDAWLQEEELLILGVFEGKVDAFIEALQILNSQIVSQGLRENIKKDFWAKPGDQFLFYPGIPGLARRILFWGLGKEKDFDIESTRLASSNMASALKALKPRTATIKVFGDDKDPRRIRATVEELILGFYEFGKYKSDKKDETLQSVRVSAEITEATERAFRVGKILAENVSLARDLTNEPSNEKTPRDFVRRATEIVENSGGKILATVLDKDDLARLALNLILAVASGSQNPPYLLILEHKPKDCKNPDGPYVFVGKGVCFDAGGLQAKGEHMPTMKMDMAGAAAVLAVVKSTAELELPFWVVGFVPLLQNLPSGSAYKPDDVIRACNGKTIEISHTDAEGRLALFDALAYAQKKYAGSRPRLVVDIATLTGACIVALGHYFAGVMGNNQESINQIIQAGEKSGDRVWQLPMDKIFDKEIESKIADLKNWGSSEGGAITAACFLKKAVEENQSWVHIDCAGPAIPKNGMASGFGVRILVQFLLNHIPQ